MRKTDRRRHELANILVTAPALRGEVVAIHKNGLRGKPSQAYMDWKHEVNALAADLGVTKTVMLERVIRQALRTLTHRQT